MADTKLDLTEFNDKKVVVIKKADDGSATEIEGTVQSGNALGLLIKPKGKTKFELIVADDIEEVRPVREEAKALTRKTLKVVELPQARNHLLERHAYTLAQVNAMSDDEALEAHNGIDHEASDLGHVHGEKGKSDREAAIESAGDES